MHPTEKNHDTGPNSGSDHEDGPTPAEGVGSVSDGDAGGKRALAAIVGGALLGMLGRSVRRRIPRLRGRRLKRFWLGILIVVSSVATCSYGVDPGELAAAYGDPVPTSAEEAKTFLTRSADVLGGLGNSNTVAVTVTESEATSVLSLGLMIPELALVTERIPPEEIQASRDLEALRERIHREADAVRREMAERMNLTQRILLMLDPRIRTGDVQVKFDRDGRVILAGYVQAWRFRQAGLFVLAPSVQNGELELDFVEGRLGRLPAPELVFDVLGDLLSSALLLGREYAEISEVTVREGSLRLVGRFGR